MIEWLSALRHLKGHHVGIVYVTLSGLAFAAAGHAPDWLVFSIYVVTVIAYHVRCNTGEEHGRRMADKKIEEQNAKVELVKARHRDLVESGQPTLPLAPRPRQTPKKPDSKLTS